MHNSDFQSSGYVLTGDWIFFHERSAFAVELLVIQSHTCSCVCVSSCCSPPAELFFAKVGLQLRLDTLDMAARREQESVQQIQMIDPKVRLRRGGATVLWPPITAGTAEF